MNESIKRRSDMKKSLTLLLIDLYKRYHLFLVEMNRFLLSFNFTLTATVKTSRYYLSKLYYRISHNHFFFLKNINITPATASITPQKIK